MTALPRTHVLIVKLVCASCICIALSYAAHQPAGAQRVTPVDRASTFKHKKIGPSAPFNNAPQALPFAQDWTNTGLITTDDDWSGVPGIEGQYLRNIDVTTEGIDPRTLTGDTFGLGTTTVEIFVTANQTATTNTQGDIAEFHTTSQPTPFDMNNPVVGLQPSFDLDAPFLLLNLDTTARADIAVSYVVRDIDCSDDNAAQPVVTQFRVGNTGPYTNLGDYTADTTQGPPNRCNQVSFMGDTLPAAANNKPLVQVRIITANAVGADEWIGIDNISVTGIFLTAANVSV